MDYNKALEKLEKYGQEHVLRYYDELDDGQKKELLAQIEATDFSVVALCEKGLAEIVKGEISPLAAMQLSEIEDHEQDFRALGVDAIKQGKVGAVLLALEPERLIFKVVVFVILKSRLLRTLIRS